MKIEKSYEPISCFGPASLCRFGRVDSGRANNGDKKHNFYNRNTLQSLECAIRKTLNPEVRVMDSDRDDGCSCSANLVKNNLRIC